MQWKRPFGTLSATRTGVRAIIAGLFVVPGLAQAQQALDAPAEAATERTPTWRAAIGVGALVIPEYEGSRDLRVVPLPVLDVTWRNTVFLNVADGVGVYAVNDSRFTLGAGVTYGIGRYESYSPRLRGLGDVKDAPRPRVFGRVYAGPLFLGASVSRDIGGSDGLLADASIGISAPVSASLQLRAVASATYADAKHMRAFFGVTPTQSARSGLRVFAPEAGFKRADASLGATLRLSRRWAIDVNGGAGRLLGDAARSPVIERKWQPFALAGLTYAF